MQQCSICLDDLRDGPTLACGHRFHAACLARLAGANGTTPTRRGALTTCPNCRTVSSALRNYLEGALALARAGDAYRTEAEYKPRLAPARAPKTSRFTGIFRDPYNAGKWRAAIKVRGSSVELGTYDDEEDAARAYDAAVVKYRGKPTVNFPGEVPLASVLAALPDAPAVTAAAPRRSGRAPVPKRKVEASGPALRCERGLPIERGKHIYKPKKVDGATQKKNGKWTNHDIFPGREFDDLDAFRAAKKQHVERRAAYSDQIPEWHKN